MDVQSLKSRALSKKATFKKLVQRLKKKKDRELDPFFQELHTDAFEQVDCLECANCCKTAGPRIFPKDVQRMADHLKMSPSLVNDKYLKIDEDGDLVMNTLPCPFLGSDNYCSIYTARPKACREYPHTDRKKQKQLLDLHLKNTEYCPAVLKIFENIDLK